MRLLNRHSYILFAIFVFSLASYVAFRSGLTPVKLLALSLLGFFLILPLRTTFRPSVSTPVVVSGHAAIVEIYSRY